MPGIRQVLVTRPAEDAAPLARALEAGGLMPFIEPLLSIRFLDRPVPELAGLQALAFTSANGVRALVHAVPEAPGSGLPVFAVGPATAEAARRAGFNEVIGADGDAAALARLIVGRLDAKAGPVLHVVGSDRAGNLLGRIEAAGFTARRAILYEAAAAEALSPELVAAIFAGAIGWVLIFSPRTARLFVTLMEHAGLAPEARGMCLVALSRAVAEAASPLPWGEVRVAAALRQEALLEALGQAAQGD